MVGMVPPGSPAENECTAPAANKDDREFGPSIFEEWRPASHKPLLPISASDPGEEVVGHIANAGRVRRYPKHTGPGSHSSPKPPLSPPMIHFFCSADSSLHHAHAARPRIRPVREFAIALVQVPVLLFLNVVTNSLHFRARELRMRCRRSRCAREPQSACGISRCDRSARVVGQGNMPEVDDNPGDGNDPSAASMFSGSHPASASVDPFARSGGSLDPFSSNRTNSREKIVVTHCRVPPHRRTGLWARV